MASHAPYGHASSAKQPVLLLMDSPRKEDGRRVPWTTDGDDAGEEEEEEIHKPTAATLQIHKASLVRGAAGIVRTSSQPPESLGRLLVEMTAQVQAERSRRSDVETKNQSLMLEIEQLQKALLDLKTSNEQQTRRRASSDLGWDAATRADYIDLPNAHGDASVAEFWSRELQDAKRAKDAALADAHRRALEVMELQACISMQHDELKALRASESDVRFALTQAEDQVKERAQQHAIVGQENQLLKDDVAHLNAEMGKRGVHFKALMDKWSEAQAQCEHVERENRAMLDKMKDLRTKHEQLQREVEHARDERDGLQHQANHLKGAVAAKTAEAKAFQAYGHNARDHLQAQEAMIQRHAIYRRKVHHVARDSAVLVKGIKITLASVRAPLVAIQHDFKTFLKHLQTPVLSLVARSRRFAEVAFIEHRPLRAALAYAELARRHLHDQLWRARRNALLVCQIRNLATPSSSSMEEAMPGETLGAEGVAVAKRTLRANYGTGELLLRESERESITIQCDAVFSDRARGTRCWNHCESVAPLLQSVLDGVNGCVATFDGLPLLKQPESQLEEMGVPELVLTQLFGMLYHGGAQFHRVKLTVSFLGVYNEAIYDLLGLDPHATATTAQTHAQSMSKIVVLEVQNVEEALLVLRGGGENLAAAHDLSMVDKFLTHKVITVCVVHENLLLSGSGNGPVTTKSKLQIVELATGPNELDNPSWDDRSRVKAHVAMDNGVQALLTTLADVRVAADSSGGGGPSKTSISSGAFVRYHSSKLTVLLQDTVKATAKFLVLAALPGAVVSSSGTHAPPQLDARAAQATRWMFHMRNAVGSVAGSHSGTHGSSDRSVEGFINRFTSQQSHADNGSAKTGNAVAFSSSEMAERPPLTTDVDPRRWEKELDHMNRRYGDLRAFTTAFYQPATMATDTALRRRLSYDENDEGFTATAAISPCRQSATITNAEQLTDVVLRPEELLAMDATDCNTLLLPPAPAKTGRTKSKVGSKSYRGLPGHHNGVKGTKSTMDKSRRRMTMQAMDSTVMTLAPTRLTPERATSVVKVRRETASSVLKKVLSGVSATKRHHANAHADSATYHHAASLINSNSTTPWVATMTATTATQARLQNRKIPFK